jgi:hypothetical protein
MITPVYQDIFELYIIETEDAYYNLGILYRVLTNIQIFAIMVK